MTTLILILTPDASPAAVERLLTELDAVFPQHEFIAGDPDICGYDNNILAQHGSPGCEGEPAIVLLPDADEVRGIHAVFSRTLNNLKGCKPS